MLFVPQLAAAKVFMCVDQATGQTSFTDKACEEHMPGEKVRVDVANPGSGSPAPRKNRNHAWQSQRDMSKSGIDHNQQRREAYTDRVNAVAVHAGS